MRSRFVVTILALTLSAQTALAAVCATGCATMTAPASHHGNDSSSVAPAVADSHSQHQNHHAAASEPVAFGGANPASASATAMKCPLPDSVNQRSRPTPEMTFAAAATLPVLFTPSASPASVPPAAVPPDLSPPGRFSVLRI